MLFQQLDVERKRVSKRQQKYPVKRIQRSKCTGLCDGYLYEFKSIWEECTKGS